MRRNNKLERKPMYLVSLNYVNNSIYALANWNQMPIKASYFPFRI